MSDDRSKIPLVLFAKAPIAGNVKTRLTSHCSDQQAAAIAEILIEASLGKVLQYWPGKVYLSVWQFDQHPFIVSMLERFAIQLLPQVAGDLGVKMQSTFDQLGYPTAIMGCDAPLVTAESLIKTHSALSQGKHVIGPSEDGGYYLIGASDSIKPVFNNINWGTESVLVETLDLASANRTEFTTLPKSYDIDIWDDVLRASAHIPSLQAYIESQNIGFTSQH